MNIFQRVYYYCFDYKKYQSYQESLKPKLKYAYECEVIDNNNKLIGFYNVLFYENADQTMRYYKIINEELFNLTENHNHDRNYFDLWVLIGKFFYINHIVLKYGNMIDVNEFTSDDFKIKKQSIENDDTNVVYVNEWGKK